MLQDFPVGRDDDFPEGSRRILSVGGHSIGVYRSRGQLYAAQNICPHALAPICIENLSGTYLPSQPGQYVYGMEGFVLRCPWHGWEFDIRSGAALFNTDRRRLATFPVIVVDGEVRVRLRPRRPDAEQRVEAGLLHE